MLNKTKFENNIYSILREAYLGTFDGNTHTAESVDVIKTMADQFASIAAPKLASAIDSYIKSADITLSVAPVQSFTLVGTCGVGPVTGTAVGPLQGEIKLGIK